MKRGSSNRWKICPVRNLVALTRNRAWSSDGRPRMSGMTGLRRPFHCRLYVIVSIWCAALGNGHLYNAWWVRWRRRIVRDQLEVCPRWSMQRVSFKKLSKTKSYVVILRGRPAVSVIYLGGPQDSGFTIVLLPSSSSAWS